MNWTTIFHPPWKPNPAISNEAVESLKASAPFVLSSEYLELLCWSDGGEGPLGEVYLNLWTSVDAGKLNIGYKIGEFLPNMWAIGDDSAHFYALEFTQNKGIEAVRFPMGFMHPTAINSRLPSLEAMFRRLASGELF